MRKKNFLRTRSVTAAAFCAALVIMSCGNPIGERSDNSKSKETLTLMSLSLICDGQSLNGFSFESKTDYYKLELEKETSGKDLTVTAEAASSGVTIAVTVDGSKIDNGGAIVLPKTGEGAKQITISLSKANANPAEYKVDLNPKQSSSTEDGALGRVYIGYTETSGTLMTGAVEGLTGTAKSTDRTKTAAVVIAQAASSKAAIELSYGGVSKSGADGIAKMDSIRLPGVDSSEKLEIRITSADGHTSMTYTITVKGFVQNEVEWHIKMSYSGSEGMQIRGVMAMNRAGDLESAQPDNAETHELWTLRVGNLYKPAFFTVNLRKQTGTDTSDPDNPKPAYEYKQSKAFVLPEGINAAGDTSAASPIQLTITDNDIGRLITNADDFYNWLNSATGTNSKYALGSDIDLSKRTQNATTDWIGPTYKGKFYGNGFTIKNLVMTNTSQDNGLFKELTSEGAEPTVIENFTLEVSALDYKARTGVSRFGGMVGIVANDKNNNAPTIEIRNVTVKGRMEIGVANTSAHYLSGGLIGEIYDAASITIENCASELVFDIKENTSAYVVAGGLIGRVWNHQTNSSTITIKNSYATGDITMIGTMSNGAIITGGGLVSEIGAESGKTITVILEKSYAAGNVSVTGPANGSNHTDGAGGLIGLIHYSGKVNITVKKCAAVGMKAALFTSGASSWANGRLAGVLANNKNINPTFADNIARLGMLVGTGGADDAVGEADDATAASTISNNTGSNTAVAVKGLGKTQEELTDASTWTDGLGWSASVWDFSGLKSNPPVWPTFNKAKYE